MINRRFFLKFGLSGLVLLFFTRLSAQNVSYSFDDSIAGWKINKGKVELLEQGSHKGKAMKLHPNTLVSLDMDLQPASTYRLTVWMRTESGADNVTVQTNMLGKNNVSATTALASWTKIERLFHVSPLRRPAGWNLFSRIMPIRLAPGWMRSMWNM